MFSEVIMLVLEIVGTISFAVSGAFVAIKARLDIFGVVFVGAITAVGGGIVRDILIGKFPPAIFTNLPIFLTAAVSAVIIFIIAYANKEKLDRVEAKIENVNNFFDAVGLGAFSVMGTEVSFIHGFSDNMFLSIVLGMITGVGGGVFRDILTDTTPYIFRKHIYAIASILGSGLYYIIRKYLDRQILASVTAMVFVVIVRMLARKYRWSLPKIKL